MTKVGVVAGGGFQGQALLDQLEAAGEHAVVFDVFAENVNMYAATYRLLPLLASDEFLPELLHNCEQQNVTTLFPATAREQYLLAENREMFSARGVDVAVSDTELLRIISDKRTVKEWLSQRGIPVLAHEDSPTRFPVIVKPRDGWGGRGILIVDSEQELDEFKTGNDFSTFVCERLLPEFAEYSADFSIRPDGSVSPLVVRRRERVSGGFAVVSTTTEDAALHSATRALAHELAADGGRGVFCVQLLRDSEGDLVVSDVNPRIGTSASVGLAHGVNIVAFYLGTSSGGRTAVPTRAVRRLTTVGYPLLGALPISGVVFDLDDTLLDHEAWMLERFSNACAALGYEPELTAQVREAACLFVEGRNWGALVDDVAQYCGFDHASGQELLDAYRSAVGSGGCAVRGAVESVVALQDAGLSVAVLTNNSASAAAAKMKALGLDATPLVAVTGFHSKPAASAFVAAAESMEVAAENLIMVGDDGFRDSVGALRAGFAAAVTVPGPRGHRSRSFRSVLSAEQQSRCFQLESLCALPALLGAK